MKKAVVVAVVILAVVALCLPSVVGGRIEASMRSQIERMNENPMLAMRVTAFDRGWFSSQAQVEVALDERYLDMIEASAALDPAEAAELTQMITEGAITVPVDLAHGPVILMDGLYFGFTRLHAVLDERDELSAMAIEELGLDYLAELRGEVSYLGTFTFTSNITPIEYIDEGGELSFSGLNVDGSLRGQDLRLDGGMDRLVIDTEGTLMAIDTMSFSSDASRINQIFWAGDFDSGIANMMIVDTLAGTDGAIEIAGLGMSGGLELDDTGDLFDASATYAAAAIRMPAQDMELTDAQLTVGFERLSVDAMTDYYETALNLDLEDPSAAAMTLQQIVLRLLANNPAVSFDPIRFTLDGDTLNAAIRLSTVNGDQGNIDLANPMMLLGLFEASASLTAAKALVERLAAQAVAAQMGAMDPSQLPPGQDAESMAAAQSELTIGILLGQGYLIEDGDNYTTELEYLNGEVFVNGNVMPLGALMQ